MTRLLWNYFQLYRGLLSPLLVVLALIGIVVALVLAMWLLAAILAIAAVVIGVLNYRDFRIMAAIGGGHRHCKSGKYQEAADALHQALSLATGLSPHDPRRVLIAQDFGRAMRLLGDYTEAETQGKLAVELAEAVWGRASSDCLVAMVDLAETYLNIARFAEAESLLLEVLQQGSTILLHDPLGQAKCHAMLGRLYTSQERNAAAETHYRQGLSLLENDVGLASSLDYHLMALGMVEVLVAQTKVEEADAAAELAVDRAQKQAPPQPFILASSMSLLARVRHMQARPVEAEAKARQALAVMEAALGPDDPRLAIDLMPLGVILAARKQWSEAETIVRRALDLRDRFLAPEHPLIAESLELLAEILAKTGRQREADECNHRAHQIRDYHRSTRA